jgi:hypothetical protein
MKRVDGQGVGAMLEFLLTNLNFVFNDQMCIKNFYLNSLVPVGDGSFVLILRIRKLPLRSVWRNGHRIRHRN